jgi:hypothetical protein
MLDNVVRKAYNIYMSENEVSRDDIIDEVWTWLQIGIDKGWVTEPFCYTHDGDPYMTEEEEKEWEDGGDPCAPVIKVLV